MPPLLTRRPSVSCCSIHPMTAAGRRQTHPLQRQMDGSRDAQRRRSRRREIPAQAGCHTCPKQARVLLVFTLVNSFLSYCLPS